MDQKNKRMDIRPLVELVPVFAADEAVALVFLFGSHARGEAGPLSDVDVALLLSPVIPREEYLNYRLKYSAVIANAIRDDRVEVVLLNSAPPALAHQVIRGRVLYERTAEARVQFIVDVQRKYLDLKAFYAIDHAYMQQRLEERRLGQP